MKGMYMFLLYLGESRMLPFLVTLATSSALLFMALVVRQELGIAWAIRYLPLRTGGGVMVPFKRKPKIVSLSFVVSLGGSLSNNTGLRDTYLIPGSKG